MTKPVLTLTFKFDEKEESTIVEVTGDHEEIWIQVRNHDDHEDGGRSIYLRADEADVFISSLALFKNRMLNPINKDSEDVNLYQLEKNFKGVKKNEEA